MSSTKSHDLLGPEGPLAQAMAGYEHRQGQLDMAAAVERAFEEDRILLCEAGTGTGKTLAYLVPALTSGRRVVVSTASRALQEQIVLKDLPLVRRHLGLDLSAVMVKGLSNYLCLRRYDELKHDVGLAGGKPTLEKALPLVQRWSERTSTGDIAELDDLAEQHPIWPQITSSSETRIGPRCPHFEACHVTRLKRDAEQAQLLVVNHHLFFADLAVKGDHPAGVLPPYDAVVLDEAHKLEEIASSFFGARFSSTSALRVLSDVERAFRAARQEPPRALVDRIRNELDALFATLNVALGQGGDSGRDLPASCWQGDLLDRYHELDDGLDALERLAADAATHETLQHAASRVARQRQALAAIVQPAATTVTWVERQGAGLSLYASPVDVGPTLRERLFATGTAVVMTSASLTSLAGFGFVRSRLGLDEPLDAPVDELLVSSSIDHRAQALLYVPGDLPAVDEPNFREAAAKRVLDLQRRGEGGAFVLCTSLEAMRDLARRLREQLGTPVLMQGDAPKATLLTRFREQGDALLVATLSFWEGVDVPGRALSLVVVDRLPFAVPSDPLVQARGRALRQRGASPFEHDTLPRAAIVLKQGVGRLLRSRRDHGVVAILDGRIRTKGYGRRLLASLPDMPLTSDLEDVDQFWQRVRDEREAW